MDLFEIDKMRRMKKTLQFKSCANCIKRFFFFNQLALKRQLHEICKIQQELQTAGGRDGTTDFLISTLLTNS